jgi:protein-tyrosine kinase
MYRDIPAATHPTLTADPVPPPQSIGDILAGVRNLSPEQVERIVALQRERGLRFGEAAVSLGLASDQDVVQALSRQFGYACTRPERHDAQPELVVAVRPFSPHAEAFRAIRAQLMMRVYGTQAPRRAVAVISPAIGDGKTYFAANIAAAFSQLGGRTLLIDADMRSPRQHALFGVAPGQGLSGVLSGRADMQVLQPVPDLPGLCVLPAGAVPPNPLELVERPLFGQLLDEALGGFDHVVVDTPAFAHGMDGPVIAGKCGAALIVARRGRSHVAALQDLVATLSESPAQVAGVILNEF